MAFSRFRSFIKSSRSSVITNTNATIDEETIKRLCDRLQSTAQVQDREEIISALKTFSEKYEFEAGNQSITLLAKILQGDRNDSDLIQLIFEGLTYIMTRHVGRDEEPSNLLRDSGVQLTELFIQNNQNVDVLLGFVGKNNFNVRRAAIQLLTALLTNSTPVLQDIILERKPVILTKLIDLLKEKNEGIRNDGLVLFQILTSSNWKIQETVVRRFGFDRLFQIVDNEEDITVERCFSLLINLLENNPSNQRLFHQSAQVHELVRFIRVDSVDEECWSAQKATNVRLLLQIIRTMTRSPNCENLTFLWQRTLRECGILHRLCLLLKLVMLPADVLIETISTIGDIIRGDVENQKLFGVVANKDGIIQLSALFNLFKAMIVNKNQSFQFRTRILYLIQCYLYNNDIEKLIIVEALSKSENAGDQYSLCHLLLTGYLSKDSVSSWCSGVVLSYLIADSPKCQKEMLKVVSVVDHGQSSAKSLMEISIDLLQNASSSFHNRVATLIFLCTWLSNCSLAVQAFLSVNNSTSYFVSQICLQSIVDDQELLIQTLCAFLFGLCLVFNKNLALSDSSESFERLIHDCIGSKLFEEKLNRMRTLNVFKTSIRQFEVSTEADMVLDCQFISLCNYYYGTIIEKLFKRH